MPWWSFFEVRGSVRRREDVPHRFPFRLVDTVAGDSGSRIIVISLSTNGFYNRGQGWSAPLVAEALAQGIALLHGQGVGARARLVSLHRVRLLQEVMAGDRLQVELKEEGSFGELRRYSCRALRAGALVAEGIVSIAG